MSEVKPINTSGQHFSVNMLEYQTLPEVDSIGGDVDPACMAQLFKLPKLRVCKVQEMGRFVN